LCFVVGFFKIGSLELFAQMVSNLDSPDLSHWCLAHSGLYTNFL
jgi:hypothetical protein